MNLHGHPVEGTTTLPDGRDVTVRVAIPEDDYIAERDETTVALTLLLRHEGHDHVLAALNTVLAPEDYAEAEGLVRELLAALASGDVEPDGGDLERFADSIPDVRRDS